MRRESAITIAATGGNINAGAASARIAIPSTSAGTKPAYIRVTATQPAYVRLGCDNTVVAAAGDAMVQPADSLILSVGGNTHIAAIQVSAASIVNVVPLEDVA